MKTHGRSVEWDKCHSPPRPYQSCSYFRRVEPYAFVLSGCARTGWMIAETLLILPCFQHLIRIIINLFRIMVRDIGVMQMHCVNDGVEVAKFYTAANGRLSVGMKTFSAGTTSLMWPDENESNFYINGELKESLAYAGGEGNQRAFSPMWRTSILSPWVNI